MLRLDDHFPANAPRLAHIRQVVALAHRLEHRKSFGGRLIAAAVYHDIGYAPDLAATGFHPVDGAVLAKTHGLDAGTVDAVLHHSGARSLAVMTRPDLLCHYGARCRMMETELSRALTFCDNRSGPLGEPLSLDARAADIRRRHAAAPAILAVLETSMPRFCAIDAEFRALLD